MGNRYLNFQFILSTLEFIYIFVWLVYLFELDTRALYLTTYPLLHLSMKNYFTSQRVVFSTHFKILSTFSSLFLFFSIPTWGQVGMGFSTNTVDVAFGDKFTLAVKVNLFDHSFIDAAEVHLDFDPNALQVISLEGSEGKLPTNFIAPQFNNESGEIDYAAGSLVGPITESFTFLVIEFQAISEVIGSQVFFKVQFPRETIITTEGANVLSGGLSSASINVVRPTLPCEEFITFGGEVLTTTPFLLRAGSLITLTPGFHAANGRIFSAKIGACTIDNDANNNQVTAANIAQPDVSISAPVSATLSMNFQPNPANSYVEICLTSNLQEEAPAMFQFWNISGQLVKTYRGDNISPTNTYTCFPFSTTDLPVGTYFIHAIVGTQRTSKTLVITD